MLRFLSGLVTGLWIGQQRPPFDFNKLLVDLIQWIQALQVPRLRPDVQAEQH